MILFNHDNAGKLPLAMFMLKYVYVEVVLPCVSSNAFCYF